MVAQARGIRRNIPDGLTPPRAVTATDEGTSRLPGATAFQGYRGRAGARAARLQQWRGPPSWSVSSALRRWASDGQGQGEESPVPGVGGGSPRQPHDGLARLEHADGGCEGHPDPGAEVQLHRGLAPQGTPPSAPFRACGRGLSSRLSTRLPVHGPSTRSRSFRGMDISHEVRALHLRTASQVGAGMVSGPVSYTHLRAHETVLDLVCRLLLEKKKNK